MMILSILGVCSCLLGGAIGLNLEVLYQWNLLDFDVPYYYNYNDIRLENTVFTGLELDENRLFLAMPRLRAGVPATLATVDRRAPPGSSPTLSAYPSWAMHVPTTGQGNCSRLISVYRIRMDSCKRLWVLDSGVMDSIDAFTRVCQPKILVFDTLADQLVRTVVFPDGVLKPASLLTNLVIDESIQGRCDSAFIYMSDTAAPGLVVYDAAKDHAWRISHPSMFPDPDYSDYLIDGETFTLMDGVVGITHSPNLATLFFQPLATDRIFSIPTSALIKGPPAEFEKLPITLAGRKSSQGAGITVNLYDDTVYFSPVQETSIASWNPLSNKQKLLVYDVQRLQFLPDLRWKGDGYVWAISTRFQKFFLRTVKPNEINLRVIRLRLRNEVLGNLPNSLYL